jgi:type VI secretion system secreted protein VgrG
MLLTRSATFASPLGERVMFYAFTGREQLGRPFTYEVELLSDDDSIDLSELLGQPATVVLERTDGSIREFNGFVTEFSLIGQHGNFARYRAVMHPWLWFLGQRRNSRIFQEKTVPEIVQSLFREHGFSDFEAALGEYRTWEYIVQYRESDLNFISRILEQEGIYYFFKHQEGKTILVLADSPSAHEAAPGYERVPYFPPMERERRQEEHIDTWRLSRQIRTGTFTVSDFNFEQPSALLASQISLPFEHARGDYEIYDHPAEVKELPEAEAQAKIRLEEHQADHEVVRGGGPVRGLMAGSRFALDLFPREDQNKEYVVVSAAYEIRVAEFESNEPQDRDPLFRFELTAIDAKRPFRPPRLTRKPIVEGPQTAIVVGLEGKEIWTDQYGRVKVQFHWDREGQYNEQSSCWVRVSQVWAGVNWGAMHIPRIGQEVIVDFLEGDPDRPIITGRVYNADNMPPYDLPDNQTQSGIKSRSTQGGSPDNFNEIRFEDKKGEEELYIQAEKNMTTLVKNDQSTSVKANRSASVGGSDSVSVGGDRSLSVNGNLSVTVKGGGKSPVHSTHSVTGKHSVDASDTIEMTAPTHIKLTVGGSSILIEPGAITITAGDGASIRLDPNMFASSKNGGKMVLDANVFAEANGKAKLLLDANVLAESSGKSQMVLDANALVKSNADVIIDGMSVTAKGKTQATMQVGGSSFQCSPAGSNVAGPTINVNGTGMVSIAGPMIKIG